MNGAELKLEAAFAIAVARDDCLRRVLAMGVDRELVKMLWSLGYLNGMNDAYVKVGDVLERTFK